MELMQQGNLRDLLEKKGRNLNWPMRLNFAISAALGISYLHQNRIIHRDLKPQNLLVNREWVCKVSDFGISTIKLNGLVSQEMTVIGTPVYMAPEIFTDNKYSEKVDVYAFGILLNELYCDRKPYSEEELAALPQAQLLMRICDGLRPDISSLPSALKQLVEDAWNPIPKMRPSFQEIGVRLPRMGNLTLPLIERQRNVQCEESISFGSSRSRWLTLPEANVDSQSLEIDDFDDSECESESRVHLTTE